MLAAVDEEACKNTSESEDWHNWCRLCAKVDMHSKQIFVGYQPFKSSIEKSDRDNDYKMASAIEKYFCVQIKDDDDLPKSLCTECISLVSTIIDFNKRVDKVQEMYAALHETDCKKYLDFVSVWLKDGTLKETPDCVSILQYEEKAFVEQIDHAIMSNMHEVHLREEIPHACNQFDEVTCVFEEEGGKDEDPFASDIDVDSLESNIISKRKRSYKNVCVYETKKSHEHKYFCSNCSLRFQRLGNYRIHMKNRHGVILEPITCPQCPKTFKNKYDLNRHIVKHRPLSETRIFPCPQCDRKFQKKDYVAKHIKFVHEDIRPCICEECGEGTRTEATLREHMLIHTDLAPFECEICKKGFKNQARLMNHMDIHSSNKHICSECGLKLNSRVTLNQHMLVHSDTMRHKCDYCGRAFKRAKTLKNHLILHSGLKPYSCQFCERTFTNGSNCRTHMKRAHPSELAELEASGKRTCTKNIPKLAVLKSV